MKSDFQAKFLMHLNQKKQDQGFTLIELLVVIIIIGILAAIALPSLLGQANKAKQSEARQNVGAINRAQQAFALGKTEFTSTMSELGIGIKTQSENYIYKIVLNDNNKKESAANVGAAYKKALKSYQGLIGTTEGDSTTGEVLTITATCESNKTTKVTGANQITAKPGSKEADIDCSKAPKVGDNNATGDWKSLSGI